VNIPARKRFRRPLESPLLVRVLVIQILGLLLAACGGGGGGGSSAPTPAPVNSAPFASAGDNQTVNAGATVLLDASGSSDSDGSIAAYRWSQTEGPEVEITNADSVQASFVAPRLNRDSELIFTVSVSDNDGASARAFVTVTALADADIPEVRISGRILPAASQSLDGDTNDPFNPLVPNDDPASPQSIGNPTTLGGYVNEPGRGAEGRSQIAGDREDYFRVELLAGQSINLLVAEFQDADADLYLYTPDEELIDFSIATGQRESILVQEAGTYLVNVSIFSGATNYTLTIGSSLIPADAAHYRDVIPGQALITYSKTADMSLRRQLIQAMRMHQAGGGEGRERLMLLDDAAQDLQLLNRRVGAQAFRRQQFTDTGLAQRWNTLISIKQLAQSPAVKSAEPNYRIYPLLNVNDGGYPFQWHYPLINLPGAWDSTTGDPGIIVAVIDTGILAGHPDLAGQLVEGFDFIRDPREAGDGDGIDPNPEETIGNADPGAVNYHGTHVAGTVAARGNNGIGVTGVAFNARIMPVRAINASGGTLYDVNQAIRFAAGLDNDSGTRPATPAQIINLSLGGGGFSPSSQALYNELRNLGVIVVAAAGNEGSSVLSYPASYDNVISVSAVDTQRRITNYSNTGREIDLAAPGGNGSVDLNGDGYPDGVLSTGSADGEFAYTFLSGTSMASPHVAGVLALMKSVNPDLDGDDIDRLLENGQLSDDAGTPGRDDLYGHGIINARRAIDAALAEAGNSANVPPRLSASSSALSFGATLTRLEVLLRNSGGGELAQVALQGDQPWLTVSGESIDAQGLGRYAVTVSRDGLSPGIYEAALRASSNANDLDIRVLLSVADAQEAELGQVYLLLFDPAADAVVAQAIIERDAEGYRFELPPTPAGRYQIFAGTDLDNDLLICDGGEACGAYLTIEDPITFEFDRDRDDISFPVEYLIALPDTAAADYDGRTRGFPELQRER
jgi:serine protease